MSNASEREAHYARLADAVEARDYQVLDHAAEIRQDYRPGRPRKGDAAEGTRPLAVRLTDADRRRLVDYAERTGQPMSAVIRAAIDEYLGEHPAPALKRSNRQRGAQRPHRARGMSR